MNSIGTCRALVEDDRVLIRSYGVAGCLKAWLTGKGEAKELGNLVNGSIDKDVDTSPYSGILVTQSGRQMFYGTFREEEELPSEKEEETLPLPENKTEEPEEKSLPSIFSFDDGFTWREITTKNYPSDSLSVRYILSHRSFYNAFMLHGRYFYGENDSKIAIAIECDIKNEPHPLPLLSDFTVFKDGYMIIAADTDSKNFYVYEY